MKVAIEACICRHTKNLHAYGQSKCYADKCRCVFYVVSPEKAWIEVEDWHALTPGTEGRKG